MNENPAIFDQIQKAIESHRVVLFMKGNKHMPMCGFSARVVEILNRCQVDFTTYNVLEDEDLRQGIKAFSNWPTIPQLYIDGEFIGGCDIVSEMYEEGELQELLGNEQA